MSGFRVLIRRAASCDAALIKEMAQVVFRKTYAEILSLEQMEYMLDWMYSDSSLEVQIEGEGKAFFIAEQEGVPCGYASVEFERICEDGTHLYHLQKLYVMPDCQGGGLGKALFRHIVDFISAESPAPCRIELNVNRHNKAVSFYEHIGMNRVREGDFPIGGGYFMNDYIYAYEFPGRKDS